MSAAVTARRPEVWGGAECTINRVHDVWFDQTERTGRRRHLDDIDRFAELGITALRVPVLWERMAPERPDLIDWCDTDAQLARLRALGIRPIVGLLHHGSGPRYTSLTDPAFPQQFARFARAVAERYPWVRDFTPVNEPLTTARFSGLYGHWYPHGRDDRTFVRILLNELRAVSLAMGAIRRVTLRARLVQTEDCGRTFGTRATAGQVEHEGHRRWLTWDLLAGVVNADHPMYGFLSRAGATAPDLGAFIDTPCVPDLLGLNYYLTSDRYLDEGLTRYPTSVHGGNGEIRYADVDAVRAYPGGIVGHEEHLVAAWNRYGIPVAITEVHLACTRDEQLRWLADAWSAARRAIGRGVDVRAVTAWALFGSYDWDSLVTRDAGHYESGVFDLRAQAPRPTALAAAIREMADGRDPAHAVLAGAGWWRRPERLTPGNPVAASAGRGAPLLVIGANGTLGRAFQRICRMRGLACRLVGRSEVDITEPAQTDAIVRRVQPWAVINAAGYVRVDNAEHDRDACRRANVRGALNVAAACRRHALPLVTFSSDLVFDGTAGRPYTENDEPHPLSVYGATKAEMESRVASMLPEALIVRSSAYFGPWDEYNFLSELLRALDADAWFDAPDDTIVSPTYVPDLVHATLDLLIDGERGIWHLANVGAITWYDFAVAAATLTGRPVARIRPVRTAARWTPAPRPANSALTSTRGLVMRPLEAALTAFAEALNHVSVVGADTCASP